MGKIIVHVHKTKDANFNAKAYEISKGLIHIGMKVTALMTEARAEKDPATPKLKAAFEAIEHARNLLAQI